MSETDTQTEQTAASPKALQHRIDGPADAPLLVLGPALGTTWHMWDRQIPELTRNWRVLRYDLPGHGGAPAHPASAVAELTGRLLATLDSIGADRFGYAGCSIGGAIGAQLALTQPHRLTSLALISSSPRQGTADEWRQRGVVIRTNGLDPIARTTPERWFTPGFTAVQTAIVEWAVQMVRTTDPGCYIAACEALAAFDIRDALPRITVPTLVVAGAEDQAAPPADARALVAGIPDARLAMVPGAAHLTPVERPGEVTELLVKHFSTVWQDGTAVGAHTAAPAPVLDPTPPHSTAVAELTAGDQPARRPDPYDTGMRIRREVLGDAHVDRATEAADDFTGDFQDFLTRYAWGEVWSRPGLDRRTRSVITLTALAARGHLDELAFHTRAALRNGLTPVEIRETLLHTAVYCGVPAANSAFAVAQRVVREETTPER
ncbi:4-carboxymuconolactone decarboxylase [Streptomyces gobiensis]|uniref:bifunctional 3-oxoadipate enol-lactonase/4-carboxymuconolactone decarboxylase PcaDC n=1 Tax=Streptomyces gobiensis TaxID=2875706 RepID=UPI001E29299E|nr:4-carboxymuconolactone decarboxylase [Streptomyces gobiensis]UGY94336.1 4-carboxymuconolactone decarboxylase [Streptomyces gobiensis]